MNPYISERLPNQLGADDRPLIMRVQTTQRFEQVAQICDKYKLKYIMGIEFQEDVTDLRKAILMSIPHVLAAADRSSNSAAPANGRTLILSNS
jgi:hypothetical protein